MALLAGHAGRVIHRTLGTGGAASRALWRAVAVPRLDAALPAWLDWARRPWDTVVSGLLLRPVTERRAADAVLLVLRKPDAPADATGSSP